LNTNATIFDVKNKTAKLSVFQCSIFQNSSYLWNFIRVSSGGEISLTLVSFINSTYSWSYSLVSISSKLYQVSVLFRSCNISNHIHTMYSLMLHCDFYTSFRRVSIFIGCKKFCYLCRICRMMMMLIST
jgi:hypothetical protein